MDASDLNLQDALERSRSQLDSVGNLSASREWLRPKLDTPEGTKQARQPKLWGYAESAGRENKVLQVYQLLEEHVSDAAFLHKLSAAHGRAAKGDSLVGHTGNEVLQADWWEVPAEAARDGFAGIQLAERQQAPVEEDLDSYVVIERTDVLDAISTFIATYLAELPEARNLKPDELQAALQGALKELRKGRTQRLWEWGRCIYRCAAFGYGAFSMYTNPWLVRALLAALWTASRLMIGMI